VTPRKLDVINLDGEAYFLDLRLSQLRNVRKPHDFIDLPSSERRDFLEALLHLELAQRAGSDPPMRVEGKENTT